MSKKYLSVVVATAAAALSAFADVQSGYTQLEWIESDGHQYIDTGVKAQSGLIVSADMRLLSNDPRQALFGGADDGYNVNPLAISTRATSDSSHATLREHYSKLGSYTTYQFTLGTTYNARIYATRATWKIDNGYLTFNGYHPSSIGTLSAQTYQSTNNIFICWMSGPNGGSSTCAPAAAIVYGFDIQLKSDSSYLRRLVPALRDSDGAVGMYDLENDVFYPGLGSKAFRPGPRVSSVYSGTGMSLGMRAELTIGGYNGGATVLRKLPVLVRISPDKISGFAYSSCLAGGADIFFATDENGENRLACDIETWDVEGTSLAWVKLPEVTGTETKFYIFWGSGEVAARPASTEVWSEYVAVWHMNECDPVAGVADETGHGFNATNSATNVSTPTDSVFGKGLLLSHGLYAPNYNTYMTLPTNALPEVISVSLWFKKPQGVSGYENALYMYDTYGGMRWGWCVQTVGASKVNFKDYVALGRKSAASAKSPDNTSLPDYTVNWLHHVFTADPTNLVSYINGSRKVFNNTANTLVDMVGKRNGLLRFGTSANPIMLDEVRISRMVRNTTWVKAEYDMMTNANFVTASNMTVLQCTVVVDGQPSMFGSGVVEYGNDTDVALGTPKTYTSVATYYVSESNKADCVGWELYHDNGGTLELTRTSATPLAGEDLVTCIVTPTGFDKLIWLWDEKCLLDAEPAVAGQGTISGTGWISKCTQVAIAATPAEGYVFYRWEGDTDGMADAYSASTTVTMDKPRELKAVFLPSSVSIFNYNVSGTVDFLDPACWVDGRVPASDGTSTVMFKRPSAGVSVTVTITNAIDVADVEACFGSGTGSLSLVFGDGVATNFISGDLVLHAGATLTHTRHATTDSSKKYALNIEVGGDVTIESGAAINVSGKGFYSTKGPGEMSPADTKGASHGGTGNSGYSTYTVTAKKCYGCIRRPVLPGSGGGYNGSYGYGGGVLHLAATNGTLTVNGTISADGDTVSYGSPSGGSIWLECGSLAGRGGITAYSGHATSYSRGGGGRIALRQYAANDISAYTGYIRAGRSTVDAASYNYANSVGSIYIENANDEEDRGELLVDAYNYNNGGRALSCRLDDVITDVAVPFGKVTVTRRGRLEIPAGVTLKVTKGISVTSNGDFHTADAGGSVEIMPGEDGAFSIEGLVEAYNIYCTNSPGATISFAAGTELRNLENGNLAFTGTAEKPLALVPAGAEGTWTINIIGPDASLSTFEHVAVSNSLATGISPTAYDSVNLGGNDRWGFASDEIPEGTVFTWTGTTDAYWDTPVNWDHGIVPRDCDVALIPAGLSRYPVIRINDVHVNSVTNEEGATITLDGVNLCVSNSFYNAGTIVDGGNKIVAEGDGDVVLNFTTGEAPIVAVEKTGGSVFFPTGFESERLICDTADAVGFTFAAGAEYEFEFFNLCSRAASPHVLASSDPGTQWSLKLTARQRVRNVAVSDCDASGGEEVKVSTAFATDNGNNLNWNFGCNIVEWIAGSGSWATAANWSTGVVPGENDDVFISPAAGTVTVTASAAVSVRSLTLSGSTGNATLDTAFRVAVGENLVMYSGATAILSAKTGVNTVGGDAWLEKGAVLTHAANNKTFAYRLNLTVAGDMTLESGSSIDVREKGYATNYGPVDNVKNTVGAAHGGSHGSAIRYEGNGMDCYDSIFEPIMPGAGGLYGPGAGAVYLDVGGTLRVNGSINARAKRGTNAPPGAGSICIKAGTLCGTGSIKASPPDGTANDYKGGAGRIAIYQRTATDWSLASSLAITTSNGCEDATHGGTIYRELPQDGNRGGTIYFEGRRPGKTTYGGSRIQFPMAADGDPRSAYKNATLYLGSGTYLYVLKTATFTDGDYVRVKDVVFEDATPYVSLYNTKLRVRSLEHKDGRGWTGGDYASRVGSKVVTGGELGGIEWAEAGLSISVR